MAGYELIPVKPLAETPRKVLVSVFTGLGMFLAVSLSAIFLWGWAVAPDRPDRSRANSNDTSNSDHDAFREKWSKYFAKHAEKFSEVPVDVSDGEIQDDAIERAKLEEIRSQGKQLRKEWNALKESGNRLMLALDSLLTNSRGKRIAANERFVEQYITLREKKRPTAVDVESMGRRLDILLRPLDAINFVDFRSDFLDQIDAMAVEVRSAKREIEQDTRYLVSLLRASKTQPATSYSLKVAINRVADSKAQEELNALAEINEQERVAELARVMREKKEQLRLQAKARADEARARRTYERLRREALSPQVLTLLAPLITPDYTQPRQVTGLMAHGERTAECQPVSLSRLRSLRVLDTDEYGMKRLALLNTRGWTRRPRWQMEYEAPEPGLWSNQQFEMIRLTQRYLNRYGSILVNEGKLAP